MLRSLRFPRFLIGTLILFTGLPVISAAGAEDPPDTLLVADISHDTAGENPKAWENMLAPGQRLYANYTVDYDRSGPFIHAVSNTAGSWIERDVGEIDPAQYPTMAWEWMVRRFPEVEWERNAGEDDFAIRLELVFDYRGSPWSPLNIMRKGLITTLFRHRPPALVLSYVWSADVPADIPYQRPESDRLTVIPIESGVFTTGRWMHERRDIAADLKRLLPEERHLVLKKIRIRCDTDDSGSTAESGIRAVRFFKAPAAR